MGDRKKHPITYYLIWFLLIRLCSGVCPDEAEEKNPACLDPNPYLSVANGGDGSKLANYNDPMEFETALCPRNYGAIFWLNGVCAQNFEVKVQKHTNLDGDEEDYADADGLDDFKLPDGADENMFELKLRNGYPELNIATGQTKEDSCDNRGVWEFTVQAIDDCDEYQSEVFNFKMTIIERECIDANLWFFPNTFRENTRKPDGSWLTDSRTNRWAYILNQGVRDDVSWNDQGLDAGNGYSHNASDCLTCEKIGDTTDDGDVNDCGEVRWRMLSPFKTGTIGNTATWPEIPAGKFSDWPFYFDAGKQFQSDLNVETTEEYWEGLQPIHVEIYFDIFGHNHATRNDNLNGKEIFYIEIINPCRTVILNAVNPGFNQLMYTMGVSSDTLGADAPPFKPNNADAPITYEGFNQFGDNWASCTETVFTEYGVTAGAGFNCGPPNYDCYNFKWTIKSRASLTDPHIEITESGRIWTHTAAATRNMPWYINPLDSVTTEITQSDGDKFTYTTAFTIRTYTEDRRHESHYGELHTGGEPTDFQLSCGNGDSASTATCANQVAWSRTWPWPWNPTEWGVDMKLELVKYKYGDTNGINVWNNEIRGTRACKQLLNEDCFSVDSDDWKDLADDNLNALQFEIFNPCRTAILKISVPTPVATDTNPHTNNYVFKDIQANSVDETASFFYTLGTTQNGTSATDSYYKSDTTRTGPQTGQPHYLWWTDDEVESDVDWLSGGSYADPASKYWCGNFKWFICPPKPVVAVGKHPTTGAQQIGAARTTCCTDNKQCEDEWDAAGFVKNGLAVSPRDSGKIINDISMDLAKEMAGTGNNNIPDPWYYNKDTSSDDKKINTDEVGHNPSPMWIYSKDTRMSDYWQETYTLTVRVQFERLPTFTEDLWDFADTDNRIFEKNFYIILNNPCPEAESSWFGKTRELPNWTYFLEATPLVISENVPSDPSGYSKVSRWQSQSNTIHINLASYFVHSLDFCGPIAWYAFYDYPNNTECFNVTADFETVEKNEWNNCTNQQSQNFWNITAGTGPVSRPTSYWNLTDDILLRQFGVDGETQGSNVWAAQQWEKNYWSPTSQYYPGDGTKDGSTRYQYVPCRWEDNRVTPTRVNWCYEPENYVLSVYTISVGDAGEHEICIQPFLQDYYVHKRHMDYNYQNEPNSVNPPTNTESYFCFKLQIIDCGVGTLAPPFVPNFYYHYGQDLQTMVFEPWTNAKNNANCTYDWTYTAGVIDPAPQFRNNTRYDEDIGNFQDFISFDSAKRQFTFSNIEKMHRKMDKRLRWWIRLWGSLNGGIPTWTTFYVYMDPNTTQSLKDPIARNNLCYRRWKNPRPLPTEIIEIQRNQEPEFTIEVPTDMVNRQDNGVSWSLYCNNAFATATLIGAPNFVTLLNNNVVINPFRGADSGWHTFKIVQKNPNYPQVDQETIVRIQVACLTDCQSHNTPYFLKPPQKSQFKTYGAAWIYQLPRVVDPHGKAVTIQLNTQPTLGEEFISLEQFGWYYQLVIHDKDPREFMGRIILDLTLTTIDGRRTLYSLFVIIEDSSAYAEESWGAYQYQVRQFAHAQLDLKNGATTVFPPQIDPLKVTADERGIIDIGFDQLLYPGKDFEFNKRMMRLEMIDGLDRYEGQYLEPERKLQEVEGYTELRNNFAWKFVSLTEQGVKLKVDFDEPTAVSRTPSSKQHMAVTFMTGDWLLSSESAHFVKDGTTFQVAIPPQFESNQWLRWAQVLIAFLFLCLVLSFCVVVITSYFSTEVNRQFWPMYHALQIVVVLTLYEETLPPLVIWFVEWLRDIIQLNIIPRKYLTNMLSISFIRVIYNAGGMLLLFSVPVYLLVWGVSFCAKATNRSNTGAGQLWSKVNRWMTFDGVIRLCYVNYLPMCLAAGVGRQLGQHDVEGYWSLLLLVLPPLLVTLALGVYGEPSEFKAATFQKRFGEAYSEYRYQSHMSAALFACFWLLRRILFAAFMRISLFVVRLSCYLGLQIGVFAYHGLLPYRDRWTQGIEFFNEAVISALMCFLFGFKDGRPPPFSQQTVGWVYVGLITFLVYVNTFWIVYSWLHKHYERKRLLEARRWEQRKEILAPVYVPPLPPKKDFTTELEVIQEQDEDHMNSSRFQKTYQQLDMKTPAETPNMTFIGATEQTDQDYESETDQDLESPSEIPPEALVYIFLKMVHFRNRVEIFNFFLKSWMPYAAKAETGNTLWQRRCIEQGAAHEDLNVSANLLWRRDFSWEMEKKEMTPERVLWVQDWEYETMEQVNERYGRYTALIKKQKDKQLLEAFSYERKLIKTRSVPDQIWMIKRELYYPGDDELQ